MGKMIFTATSSSMRDNQIPYNPFLIGSLPIPNNATRKKCATKELGCGFNPESNAIGPELWLPPVTGKLSEASMNENQWFRPPEVDTCQKVLVNMQHMQARARDPRHT